MTFDTSDLRTPRDQPPPDAPRDRVQLTGVQVAASALASVSAAVIASLFGVAGTVVGAGLVAIISTTGSALYSSSMKRTSNQLRRARENLLTARAGEAGSTTRPGRARSSTAVLDRPEPRRRRSGSRDESAPTDEAAPSRWRRGWLTVGGRRGLKWPALIGAAVLVFALAIAAITGFEALTNKSISSLTGNGNSSSTIGGLTGSTSSTKPTPAPTSTGSGSDAATTTPSPIATTSAKPSAAVPTPSASAKDTVPTPSAAPSSAVPQQSGNTNGGSTGSGTGGAATVPVP